MNLLVNPVITDFRQDVNGDIKMLKLGANKEDAWANIAEQGASAKLDNNKTATINVSTYTEPVVINPTSGKDGMKKATVTLSNIPSPSPATSVTFYAWESESDDIKATMSSTPEVGDNAYSIGEGKTALFFGSPYEITAIGEGTISVDNEIYTRYSDGDFTLSKSSS